MARNDRTEIRQTTDEDAVAEGEQRLAGWLHDHAASEGQAFRNDPVLFEAREGREVTGGALALYGVAWCFLKYLALPPGARGAGIGATLVAQVEAEAEARGLTGVWLDTYSFQAPGFYEALGYERVGGIADYPQDHARYFYAKRLDGRPVNPRSPKKADKMPKKAAPKKPEKATPRKSEKKAKKAKGRT